MGELVAAKVVCCAGLYSDRIPIAPATDDGEVRIVPFRGTYYHLSERAASLVKALIYPVPDPSFPFLGVHFTRHIDGEVTAGPSAVLAFAREGYARAHVNPRDLAQTLRYRGFWRLARKYWRTGLAEQWRDVWKAAFVRELQRYVPELESRELTFGPTGVRAQALARDGSLVDDFVLAGRDGALRVGNAPSPGATASLAIGRVLAERAHEMG
jgi:L-2-hydroxyglutarate oxidase LhgO